MKTYLEPSEVALLENVATNLRDKLLIRILFRLGCRVSEALGLTVEDVDFDRQAVTIKHLKARLHLSCAGCGASLGRRHAFCPECGAKVIGTHIEQQEHRRQRILPVDADSMVMLREYIRQGGPVVRDAKTMLFGINRHRAWQVVRDSGEKAGLPGLVNPETGKTHHVSPHRLRDSFAIHAMKLDDSGDGLRMLQEHLGHASFNTTAKYRKVAGEELKRWYDRLWARENDQGGHQT